MKDKYHKVVNGKVIATNLPKEKVTVLTEKQKQNLKKSSELLMNYGKKLTTYKY